MAWPFRWRSVRSAEKDWTATHSAHLLPSWPTFNLLTFSFARTKSLHNKRCQFNLVPAGHMGDLLVKPLWTGLGAQEGNKEGILCAGNDFSAGLAECVGKMLAPAGNFRHSQIENGCARPQSPFSPSRGTLPAVLLCCGQSVKLSALAKCDKLN